ncbi:alginate O-acetyltransferase AlgX-related protein [Paenibacillus dendritiformis]|uniref:alginate O-acetyltransferase AlgX-related protein n=1 Tax=Paenibacillus dendritiformis TaxID=130049 RepID=UPI00387E1235
MNDYRGTNHFSDIELEKIKNNLNERKRWLEENDIKFYITVAPNKHTIYSEYLPSNIDEYNEKSRLDQLIAYLSKNSEVEIIDLRPVLMENKEQYTLYKKNDTHWNSLGAFLAYSEIANSIKKDSVNIEPMTLDHYSIQKITCGGDLANMLSMNDIILDEHLILSPNFESGVRDVEVEKTGIPILIY